MSGPSKAPSCSSGSASPKRYGRLPRLLSTAALLLACQPELPPISWEGEVISFAANDPEAVCGDTLEWMDERAVALKGVFDTFGTSTHAHLEYYWVPDLWSDQPWCKEPAAGCAGSDQIYSEYVPHEHELAHALRRDGLPAVFEEGLAELFGDLGWTHPPAPREKLVDMLQSGDPRGKENYSRASHFVAFLLERHGPERLMQFAKITERSDSYSKVQSAFAEAYGFSLEQALVEYEDYPECNPLAWMDKRIACAEPGIPLTPGSGSDAYFSLSIDCANDGVRGPISNFMFTETTLEFTPEIQGIPFWVRLTGDIGDEVSVALVSCDGGCADSTAFWLSSDIRTRQLMLPTGRYVLRMFRPVDDPGELGIVVKL